MRKRIILVAFKIDRYYISKWNIAHEIGINALFLALILRRLSP